MQKVFLVDTTFPRPNPNKKSHTMPTKFEWEWLLPNAEQKPVVLYTDDCIPNGRRIGKTNVAVILEPEEFIPGVYSYIRENYKKFDYILTWDKKLLELDSRFVFYNLGNSWLFDGQEQLYPKTKMTSIVASWKKFLPGHKLRHEIIDKYMARYNLHWYGKKGQSEEPDGMPFDPNGQNAIIELIDAYKDYRFTIVVENVFTDYMLTEKLISPFLAGTVPIYWGMPSINKFFDTSGMLIVHNFENLESVLMDLTPELYEKFLPAVKRNFITANKYKSMPDNIFDALTSLGLTDAN